MYDVVLTADRTLMTEYRGASILGNVACFPQRLVPTLIRSLIFPRIRHDRATYALRKVESTLVDQGFSVRILAPQDINKIKKLRPQVVGISTVDPLTKKPQSWTLTTILGGGPSVVEDEFFQLLGKIQRLRTKLDFTIIIGGPGASEFEETNEFDSLFDSIVIGQAEGSVDLFHAAVRKKSLPKTYYAQSVHPSDYSVMKGPARLGHVQVTIGCPRKCQFCAPCLHPWMSLSKDHILKEVDINARNGLKQVSLISDDLLLYGAKETTVNNEKLLDLITSVYQRMQKYDVHWLNITDVSIAAVINGKKSVNRISDEVGYSDDKPADPIIGLETGSATLIRKYMTGKAEPYDSNIWADLVKEGVDILNENCWHPFMNLIIGLPGETEDDVIQTLDLIDELKQNKLYYSPFFFVPLRGTDLSNEGFFSTDDLDQRRWELVYKCWMKTIKSAKELFLPVYFDPNKATTRREYLKIFVARSALKRMIGEIEDELKTFKNDPHGLRRSYASLNIKNHDAFSLMFKTMMKRQ